MNQNKALVIVALIVAVIGLGIGFAAFNASLTIDSGATVEAQDAFQGNVKFVADTLNCTPTGNAVLVGTPTINDTSISNLQVKFTGPGDRIVCDVDVENASAFTAYLEELKTSGPIVCTASDTGVQGVEAACAGITVKVRFDGDDEASTVIATNTTAAQSGTITDVSIASGVEDGLLRLELNYSSGSSIASGNFTVTIPTITAKFSTVD